MSADLPEGFKDTFEPLMVAAMARDHIPGLSVALVKDDQVVYARGFGARNLEANLPATPQTLWGIGSCTKSFTALAIMQLVEQGKIDLHDPVSNYLPEIKIGMKDHPITIHHFLTHSSGIPSLTVAELLIARICGIDEKWVPMSNWDDFFLYINDASASEVVVEPNNKYFYNNSGYMICGEIIERISHMKYEKHIKEKILTPLKMERSTFLKEVFENDPDVMKPYFVESKDGQKTTAASTHPFHKFIYAPGGILSSVMELSNYLQMNMNVGSFEETRLVDASLFQNMHTIHIETDWYHGRYGREGYGYGWVILEDFLGHKLILHGGSTGVSSAELAFLPNLKIGIAAAANAGESPKPVILAALALLLGKEPEAIPFFTIEKTLSMLAGVYESYKGVLRIEIVKKGGLIFLESREKLIPISAPLIPASDTLEDLKFSIISKPDEKMPVEFTINASGNIDLWFERYHFQKIGTS